jgi:hypothetical protein
VLKLAVFAILGVVTMAVAVRPESASAAPAVEKRDSHVLQAASLWKSDTLNAIADDIVGANDMLVAAEDDPVEWASFLGTDSEDVLGFVILEPPGAPLYHLIALAPYTYPVFNSWLSSDLSPESFAGNEFTFAVSAMTLIHESFHWRLLSGDESAVNACALKYFPYYVAKDFNVPATITETTTQSTPVTTTTRVPVKHVTVKQRRVRVNGRWTTHTVRKTVTTYVTRTSTTYVNQQVTTTEANPLYQTLVDDSIAFYQQQPPPYNSGTCPV